MDFWNTFWLILGPVLGGAIAAAAGLIAHMIREGSVRKEKQQLNLLKLRTYLFSFHHEMAKNLSLLKHELTDEAELLEYMSTQSRELYLYMLGELPLTEAAEAMRLIVETYVIFDETNQLLEQIQSLMERNADARILYNKRVELVKEKMPIIEWDTNQIRTLLEEIKKRLPDKHDPGQLE